MTDDRQPQLALPARRGIGYANWVGDFRSWGALKGASDLIVAGTAGAQRTTADDHNIPWTATTVRIDRSLQGDIAPGHSVDVRQTGGVTPDGTDIHIQDFPLLTPGTRYLLFLTPAVVVPDQFYPVGAPRGVFTISPDDMVDSYNVAAVEIGVAVRGIPLEQLTTTIHATTALDVRP